MPDTALSNSGIEAAYRERTRGSEALAREAAGVLPSGITHDSRYIRPYGIYVEKAKAGRKWDVDGNEYVDYFGGHGALLLGHNRAEVVEAVHAALDDGTHFGAGHPREVRWARLVQEMVPSAERVRFTSSGTEATHMALRLARAFTGKTRLLRFRAHFHGWHDHMTSGYTGHFDGSPTPGVLPSVAENVVLVDPEDAEGLAAALAAHDDIAAAIIEPTGATFGVVPASAGFIARLRELTEQHGVVLIFDEVVTGFRVSPGGAQGHYGITPDLTTLAKILAGGLPGGAVVGRKDIMDALDFERAAEAGREKILHPGTFNANPVSAAAGLAALEIIRDGDACARANDYAGELRERWNGVLEEAGVPWAAYGSFSGFMLFANPENRAITPSKFDPMEVGYEELKSKPADLMRKLRLAMLVNGVEITGWPGGLASAAHDENDLEQTVAAFRESIAMLKREGEL